MSASGASVARLSYGAFYLPSLGFGFLALQLDNPLFRFFPSVFFPGLVLEPSHFFLFFATLTFLGGLQAHGIALAIYGREGPEVRPKHKVVQIQHTLAIVLNESAERIPLVPCRIATDGIGKELLSYGVYRSQQFIIEGGLRSELEDLHDVNIPKLPPEHRLETGVGQLVEIGQMVEWRNRPRILYFLPMWLLNPMSRVTFVLLSAFLYLGPLNYIGLILLMAHFVLIFRSVIWAPIPSVINSEALSDRFIPEYDLHKCDGSFRNDSPNKKQPRIQNRKN